MEEFYLHNENLRKLLNEKFKEVQPTTLIKLRDSLLRNLVKTMSWWDRMLSKTNAKINLKQKFARVIGLM